MLRRHGVKNVCVHKGLPGLFLEQYCHTDDLARAAADFPDLNFIAFHSAFPWEAELAGQAKAAKVKNLYAELGSLARMMRTNPARYSVLIGNLLDGFGPDHILWGTDTPVIGPPHWQIEAFQTFTMPEELVGGRNYSQLTPEVKNKIFGQNAARIFDIDIAAARQAIEGDVLYKLRTTIRSRPAWRHCERSELRPYPARCWTRRRGERNSCRWSCLAVRLRPFVRSSRNVWARCAQSKGPLLEAIVALHNIHPFKPDEIRSRRQQQ